MHTHTEAPSDRHPVDPMCHTVISLGPRLSELTKTKEPTYLSLAPSDDPAKYTVCATFEPLWAYLCSHSSSAEAAHAIIAALELENAEVQSLFASKALIDHASTQAGHREILIGKLEEEVLRRWNLLSNQQKKAHLDRVWNATMIPLFEVDRATFEFAAIPAAGQA